MLTIVLTVTLASIGTAGVPGGGRLVSMSVYLLAVLQIDPAILTP